MGHLIRPYLTASYRHPFFFAQEACLHPWLLFVSELQGECSVYLMIYVLWVGGITHWGISGNITCWDVITSVPDLVWYVPAGIKKKKHLQAVKNAEVSM